MCVFSANMCCFLASQSYEQPEESTECLENRNTRRNQQEIGLTGRSEDDQEITMC